MSAAAGGDCSYKKELRPACSHLRFQPRDEDGTRMLDFLVVDLAAQPVKGDEGQDASLAQDPRMLRLCYRIQFAGKLRTWGEAAHSGRRRRI